MWTARSWIFIPAVVVAVACSESPASPGGDTAVPLFDVGGGQPKVEVCHITSSYDFGAGPVPIGHTIAIADPAYESHLAHGDPSIWTVALTASGDEVCTIDPRLRVAEIEFADARLRDAVLGTGMVYADEVVILDASNFGSVGIHSLSGIEYLVNLRQLDLSYNQLSDLSPLAGLTSLEDLHVGINFGIVDVSPLAGLTNLRILHLQVNQVADVSPLAGLVALEYLTLRSNQVSDPSPLAGLTSLVGLDLAENTISDVASLTGLVNLLFLRLYGNDLIPCSQLDLLVLELPSTEIEAPSSCVE